MDLIADSSASTPHGSAPLATHPQPRMQIDIPTAAATAVVVYLIASLGHEALGHGAACLAIGSHPTEVTTTYLQCAHESGWQGRFVYAAGSLLNILLGLACIPLLRRAVDPWRRYFCWLLCTVNLLVAGGYMMVSPFANFGDWTAFIEGLPQPFLWRAAITALGVGIGLISAERAGRWLARFVGADQTAAIRVLTLVPYLAGSSSETIASLLNPLGWKIVFISGIAASFAGTCWLIFMVPPKARTFAAQEPAQSLSLPRSRGWIALGIVALLVMLRMGRGVHLWPA